MAKVASDRIAVVSPTLAVPCLEDFEQQLIAATVRLKRNLCPGFDKGQLGYRDKQKVKALASDAHARRLREAGLEALAKGAQAEVIALARAGATLSGPSTDDEVYHLVAGLHAESPWMREVSGWVMKQLLAHLAAGGRGLALPPVILSGPPGVGKSYFARRLAELAGVPSRIIDVGGGTAGFRISGTERGWNSAQAGIPIETILASRIANPVMVVDEVDKAGTMHSVDGRATSLTTSLLPLLDPGTARRFECPFHRLSFDMSRVVWIMTANNPDCIPAPLRDRAQVFHLSGLNADEAVALFDRLTTSYDDRFGRSECRTFIGRMAVRSNGISLRHIRRLADAFRAPTGPPHH